MKSKVVNRIPGKKSQDMVLGKIPLSTPAESEKAEESLPKTVKPDDRKMQDDKNRKFEARKEFEAAVRGKLKNSRKR